MKNIIFTFCFFLICGLSQAQLKVITNGDVGVGESNPIEKLHVGGNIAMDSPETGGTTVQNRNHLIYGVGGAKRLQFSTDISSSHVFNGHSPGASHFVLFVAGVSIQGRKVSVGENQHHVLHSLCVIKMMDLVDFKLIFLIQLLVGRNVVLLRVPLTRF